MPFDTLSLAAAVHEAQPLLGSRITKIYQTDKYSVTLKLYGANGSGRLLLCAHPQAGRFQLTELSGENPAKPPLFCMVLRKHLENARLLKVRQLPNERVVRLDFAAHDEVGSSTERALMLEIMGKHSNLLLLDSSANLIIDAARRYSHNVSRYREVLPGVPYLPPPQSGLPAWQGLADDEFAAVMLAGNAGLPPAVLLQKSFAGLSPFLCRELCHRAGLGEYAVSEELGEYELSRLYQEMQSLQSRVENAAFQPILLKEGAEYADYYPLPLASKPAAAQQHFDSFSEALDRFYQSRRLRQEFNSEAARLRKLLEKERQRLSKKIKLQEADFADAENAEKYKTAGDLLTAYLYMLQPGQTQAELPDFFDPARTVRISLLPELSPVDNAKRYYHRYNKAKKAEKQISRQLGLNRDELAYVESLFAALDEAEALADLQAVAAEMQTAGYLRRQPEGRKTAAKKAAAVSQPRRYLTSDGFTLLLGRNNRQNDRLTTKLAAKDDLWLHTQKLPGSHVILKRDPNREFSRTALLEAAALAAFHSRARQASKVPVDYTEVHNVKKPNGARPGMVIYFEQQTVIVEPRDLPLFDEE